MEASRPPATIGEALSWARHQLGAADPPVDRREAGLLLAMILGHDEAWVLARDDSRQAIDAEQRSRFADMVTRRVRGEPFAYLAGSREFWGHRLAVDRRVLVPRPETEHLVETALEEGDLLSQRVRVLDVGTGSGAIALSLALARPQWQVAATDVSLGALAVARSNASRHSARVRLLGSDLDTALALGSFDLMISNPPYIDAADETSYDAAVAAWEPSVALFAANRGFAVHDRLLAAFVARPRVRRLIVEIGAGQAGKVESLAAQHGVAIDRMINDLAGIPRVLVFRRPNDPRA